MFCTDSVTRGSRSRFVGHARPWALLTTARPPATSTHTGATCTEPSRRSVATFAKFFPFSSPSVRLSIVALITPTFLAGVERRRLHHTKGPRRTLVGRRGSSETRTQRAWHAGRNGDASG